MKTRNKPMIIIAAGLILLAALSRLLPHPPNFAPIASLGIFGGTVLANKKYALIFPLGALLLSDLLFELFTDTKGFYDISQTFVYGAVILITLLATRIKKVNTVNILLACLWSAAIFFILSNFGVWLNGALYPKTFGGLMQCYYAGLPFYKNELFGNFALNIVMSNIFFSAILFGAYAVLRKAMQVSSDTQLA